MTSVRIKSHTAAIERKLEAVLKKRMKLVGEVVASQVRKNISTSTRANGPSEPGENFPHSDTGNLHKSISHFVDVSGEMIVTTIVGTPVEYAKYLEHGTTKMGSRKLLEATAEEMEEQVIAIINKPIPPGGLS